MKRQISRFLEPSQAAWEDAPFSAISGAYEFDPLTLTQRRPSRDAEAPFNDGMHSINHERTHWFQFCGSTIGSAYMSLLAAEDVLLKHGLRRDNLDRESQEYIQRCISAKLPILPLNDPRGAYPHSETPSQIAQLKEWFVDLRLARYILMDPEAWIGRSSKNAGKILANAFGTLDAVYQLHTGKPHAWPPTGLRVVFEKLVKPYKLSVNEKSFSTMHLIESGALLNEIGHEIHSTWEGAPWEQGKFLGNSNSRRHYYAGDVLKAASGKYTLVIDIALSAWSTMIPDFRKLSQTERIGFLYPTLMCCIDVALNPPIPPICSRAPAQWEEIFPPARFMRSISAVEYVGLMNSWPNGEAYIQFRSRVCDAAGLSLGQYEKRSYQNPRFSDGFFASAQEDDSILNAFSPFDYVIWVMESLHQLRRSDPLGWSMTWLTFTHSDRMFPLITNIAGAYVWAPFVWAGDEFEYAEGLSPNFLIALSIKVASAWTLKRLAINGGIADLAEVLPQEVLQDPVVASFVAKAISELLSIECGSSVVATIEERSEPKLVRPVPADTANHFVITRAQVEAQDIGPIAAAFDSLRSTPSTNINSVDFSFADFHGDGRGLWDIPEVVDYLRLLRAHVKGWAWYVHANTDPERGSAFFLLYRTFFANPRRITRDELTAWCEKVFTSLNEETVRAEETTHQTMITLNKAQTTRITEATELFMFAELS